MHWCTSGAQVVHNEGRSRGGSTEVDCHKGPRKRLDFKGLCIRACSQMSDAGVRS